MRETRCDVLIVGGGTGGCAAAMAAASMGIRVVMTEETEWVGGQLTAQAVPPDEHPWIESFGCTARYRQYRNAVRQFYREHYPLTLQARNNPRLNPGNGWVSRLCHEPRVGLAVLETMLNYPRTAGWLDVRLHRKPVRAEVQGDRVLAVAFRNLRTGEEEVIQARYVLDATELGELLPMTGTEYVVGAESQSETGEPHAVAGDPQPDNVQGITWCFAMAYDPDGDHTIDKPAQYNCWREYQPAFWPDKLLSWCTAHPITLEKTRWFLFPHETDNPYRALFTYRRIVCRDHYPPELAPHEVTIVNWPQNDYFVGTIIDQPEEVVQQRLEEARQLSLSLLYWLQTEAPRPDGGTGYPGLYLRPDITGTDDGLAMFPYIRESRRIRAVFTVTEQHVASELNPGVDRAQPFADSVGVGCYRIDLHPSTNGTNSIDIGALPFQIPLGALLPVRMRNLLPACKNIGTTHITNGCFRLHPVEWNIGEAAGLLAAFCIARGVEPHQVREDESLLRDYQSLLRAQGIELEWPQMHPV
jgi:hypothetical protein